MHQRTRESIEFGKRCGFELEGMDGNGHYVMVHPNGESVRVASSPGDLRGDNNLRAEMQRKSGFTVPKPKSGKHRRGTRLADFVPTEVRIDSDSAKYDRLAKTHRELCERIEWLRLEGDVEGCRIAVALLFEVEAGFVSMGRPVPLRTFRALP